MAKTVADLAIKVMRLPGWLDSNEEPDAEDAAFITEAYANLYAGWVLKEIAYWPQASIPDEAFEHIARIIADTVAPAFGDGGLTEIDIESGAQVGMGHKGWLGLQRLVARPKTGLPTEGSYY